MRKRAANVVRADCVPRAVRRPLTFGNPRPLRQPMEPTFVFAYGGLMLRENRARTAGEFAKLVEELKGGQVRRGKRF